MRRSFLLCGIGALLLFAPAAMAAWTGVGTGIEYQQYTISGPNNVFVTRMDRANTSAYIESSIGQGRLSGGTEVVTSQASRYDDAIGYWTQIWGTRNDVIVAINGSYYDTTTGVPYSGVVNSGWYAKRYDNVSGQSGFMWDLNRNANIGLCVTHFSDKQFITYATYNTQQFQGINVARGDNQLIIYTPQYDTSTLTDSTGSEVLVELTTPFLIKPSPYYITGTVKQIRQNLGSTQIPFDCIVLSAKGTAATTMLANVSVGNTIMVSQEIKHYMADCSTARTGIDWTKGYGAVSGNWVFLRDGVIQYGIDSTGDRHPRTAIGLDASYVYFLVVDGRQTQSIGMTIDELAAFFKNTLGATWACNQDGGGSSTMVVNGTIKNSPSDGTPRAVSDGMLMCNLVAKAQSTTFISSQSVQTTGSASCRLGPGTNYASIATIASGTSGTVQTHALNGVSAKGYYWWKVTFPTATGWVAESLLSGVGCTAPSIVTHPSNQSVVTGGTAQFTVVASGTTPLSYQWQKNSVNLSNGGHYSGVTTSTLTISTCDSSDAANYRCVVTNACGSATSNQATLTVTSGGTTFIVESRSGGQNYASYSETGTWSNSTAKSTATGCTAGIGSRYCTISSTAGKAIFSFTPTATGTYEVYTTNCSTTNSGNPMIHSVYHGAGTTNIGVCQNSTCSPNPCNVWYSLGQYGMYASTAYKVEKNGSTTAGSAPSGYAGRSDSIKWVWISSNPPPPPTTYIVESRSGGQNYTSYAEVSGTWYSSTAKSTATGCTAGIGSRFCYIGSGARAAEFRFTPSVTASYEVFTTNCSTTNSGNPMIHKVTHAGGTANINVCQNSTCTPNPCNVWRSLGTYTLNASTQYKVTMDGDTNSGAAPSGYAGRTDAILWEKQ